MGYGGRWDMGKVRYGRRCDTGKVGEGGIQGR